MSINAAPTARPAADLCGCDAHGGARQVMREASRLGGCPSLWPAYEEKREKIYWRGVEVKSKEHLPEQNFFQKIFFAGRGVGLCTFDTHKPAWRSPPSTTLMDQLKVHSRAMM
jgi:hypothetical protein